jgi:hypothetical protein
MGPFVATIFGRATLVLPSCDGPFTWIVQPIAVVTQGTLTLSLGSFTSPILVRQTPDWKTDRIRDGRARPSRTNPP